MRRFEGVLLVAAVMTASGGWAASPAEDFANPPKAAKPGVWFHIIGGNASKEGLTKDIESIAAAGLRSMHFFHEQVGKPSTWPGVTEPTPCLSKGWYGLVDHISSECRRCGVEFNMQNCPGWSTSGGPWITASNAMRHVVFSRTDMTGGKVGALPLPREANDKPDRDYRDIACLAFPTPEGDTGEAYKPTKTERKGDSFFYEFDRPVTVRSVELSKPSRYEDKEGIAPAVSFAIVAMDENRTCATVGAPRTTWMDEMGFTVAIAPTTSKKWRIDMKHGRPIHQFSAIFHSAARLDNWEGATGHFMRSVSRRPYPAQPAACWIPEGSVRELPLDGEATLPPGKWTVLRVGHVNARRVNHPAPKEATGWECSKFDRSGIEAHVRGFIDPLMKGPLSGGRLHGVLIDSWECWQQTWGYCLEEEFAKSSSFRLREWLPAVFGWVIGDPEKTRAFLRDWTGVRGRLVEENYYRRFAELMRERGLESAYESAFGDVIAGDLMRFWKWADVPTIEYWRPHTGEFVYGFELKPVRSCVSAVHLYGKKRVAAEAMTSFLLTFDETLQEIKRMADLHFGRGVTYPIFQAYTHKPEVGGKGPGSSFGAAIGTPFLREQTWWPYMKDLGEYMARCTVMLEAGKPVVDVLRYIGDDFDHRPKEPEHPAGVEAQYKIDYLNGDVLDTRLDVKDGRFVLPDGMSYSVLWLPDNVFLTDAHAERIAALERKGGKVVRGDIDAKMSATGVKPDFLSDGPLDWYHRRTADADIWFVAADTNGYAGTVSLRMPDGTRYARGLTLASGESVFLVRGRDGWSEMDPLTGATRVVPPYGGDPRHLAKWDVEFPTRKLANQLLCAWKDMPGSADDKAFSGTAVYRTRFEASGVGPLTLDLGRVRDYAEVYVNGKKVRRLWCEPYACDIGSFVKKGMNELRVDVTSSWYNRLAADAAKPESERVTWTLFGPKAGSPLHESGLLGPVRIIAPSSVASFSPSLFWWWNSKLDVQELCAQVDDFYDHGSRTLCIHPFPKGFRPGRFPCDMEPDYLTEGYLDVYEKVTEYAVKKGMTCWFYDEGGWPSGGACGQVVASDPERFALRFMKLDKEGRPEVVKVKYRPDLESSNPSVIEPGATEKFLELTHEQVKKRIGRHFGKAVPWVFTDEPSIPHGWGLGWSTDFEKEFKARKGYDVMPFVPALVRTQTKGPVPDDVRKARIDYYDVMSRLFIERFVRPNRDWCRENGLLFGGHFDGDDDMRCNLTHGHAHLLRCLREMDLPGVDCIWRQIHPDVDYSPLPRFASSAAHQTDAKRVLSETFAIFGETLSPQLMKRTVDFEMVRGVNQFVFAFAYQSTKRNFMAVGCPHLGPVDPKWAFMPAFMDYVRDTCARLAEGRNPVRVAVYYDVRSVWAGGRDEKGEGEKAYRAQIAVAKGLDARQVDFDFVDDDLIEEGRLPYDAIVFPTDRYLSETGRKRLEEFRARGGITMGPDGLDHVPRTCRVTGTGAESLRVTKRILPDGAIDYFLVNESDRTIAPEIAFDEGAKLVLPLDPYASEFVRIHPDGSVDAPAARPSVVTKRELRDGWTVRKTWSVKPGKEDFEYGDVAEAAQPCGLGDWGPLFGTNFSGRAVYRLAFTAAAGEAELDLGKVGVCASARLNGRELAPRFAPPFRWRVPLKPGTNVLEVTVGNTLANTLIPELPRIGRDYPPVSAWQYRELKFYEKDDRSSGLIGPVTLNILSVKPAAKPLPSYREDNVSDSDRARLRTEVPAALARAKGQAETYRARAERAFACASFQRRRFAKRLELFESAIAVAEKRQARGTASDLLQNERALDDLREFVRYFERELQLWAVYPENPQVKPIVLDLRDFGSKGDGRTVENAAFEKALAAARALNGRPCVLKVPAGDYLLEAAPYNLEIAGLTNFVLRGESPEKVRFVCGAYDAGCVRILNCANVTVRGLQNKFLKPTFCQGVVTAADQEAGRVEIRLAEGALPPTDPAWSNHYAVIRGSLYFPDGRIDPACPNVAYEFDADDLGDCRYAVFFSTRFTKKRYGKLTPGRVLAMPNRDNRYSAMVFAKSEFCNFEEVWVRESRAAAFTGDVASPRYTSLIGCRVFPLPGRVMSSCADSCIVPTGVYLENCDFRGMGDDGLNTLTRGGFVCGRTAPDTFVHMLNSLQYAPGTFVQFMDSATGEMLGNARVVGTTNGRWRGMDVRITKLDRPLPDGLCTYDDLGRGPLSSRALDQATVGQGTVDATPSHVYAPNWWGVGSVVTGCRFANTRCAGFVLQNSNTLVENCTVENVKTGFRINALGEFREGPPPQNVIVRNCRVSDTAEDGLIVFQNLQKSVSPTASIGFVRFEDCAFSNVRKGPAWLLSIADSLFESMTVDGRPMPISYFKSSKDNVIK